MEKVGSLDCVKLTMARARRACFQGRNGTPASVTFEPGAGCLGPRQPRHKSRSAAISLHYDLPKIMINSGHPDDEARHF